MAKVGEASALLAADHPTINVGTFLFTDIEDSTPWNLRLGDEQWLEVLTIHHGIINRECEQRDGNREGEAQGDGFLYFFTDCAAAVEAASAVQRSLRDHAWPGDYIPAVRMGLHTGVVTWSPETGRTGLEINRTNRVMSAAHGRQVLLSEATRIHLGDALPSGTEVVPAGSYRLKGFGDEAERLYELVVDGDLGSHPLRAIPASNPAHPRFNTPFVGRHGELERLRALVVSGESKLVTLVGPGGIGKTRLATELLASLANRPSLFIDLSQLDEPSLLANHLASSLGLSTSPLTEPIDLVVAELENRNDTIVLDNFEQILSAAKVVEELLHRTSCQVVVTCRGRLDLPGEHVHQVQPLGLGAMERGSTSPAAKLFVMAMGHEVGGTPELDSLDSALVEQVCERLEGLPLAIELAAARSRLIGLADLDSALENPLAVLETTGTTRPKRHRSITDTVAWSFDLLPEFAQQVFLHLSLMPGGCERNHVARLCDLDEATTLNALELLVDAQLLSSDQQSTSVRFQLPRLIRDYGAGELGQRGQLTEARRRVADLLIAIAADSRTTSRIAALTRIENELDNIRALLGWGEQSKAMGDAALQVAADLVTYWWARHPEEGLQWLQRLIAANADTDSRFMARALVRTAYLAAWRGEPDVVMEYATRGIEACEKSGRRSGTLSMALHLRALVYASFNDRRHLRLACRSLRTCRSIDRTLDGTERAIHQTNVADVYLAAGRLKPAEALYRQSLRSLEVEGEAWFRAAPTSRLGEIALRRNNLGTARRLFIESVDLWRGADSRAGSVRAIAGLARVTRAEGDLDGARGLTTEAWSVMRETKSIGEAPWVVAGLAAVAFDKGDVRSSARLLGGAVHLAKVLGQPVARTIECELADVHRGSRSRLGRRSFAEAWGGLQSSSPNDVLAAAEAVLA